MHGQTQIKKSVYLQWYYLLYYLYCIIMYVHRTIKQPARFPSSQSITQLCCTQFSLCSYSPCVVSYAISCDSPFFSLQKAPIFGYAESPRTRTINTPSVRFPFQCPISYTTDHNKSRRKTQNKNSVQWFVFVVDYCVYVIHIDHSTVIFMNKYRAV
jgi:hypothetical protein